jgi:hypothetical protein
MSRNQVDLRRLQETLRRGDPAAGEGLTTDEVHAMRRAVLNAVPEPRRRSLLLPAIVASCVALLALGLWWLRAPEPQSEPPREASVAPPAVVPMPAPPPLPVEHIAAAEPRPAVAVRPRRRPPVAVAAVTPLGPAVVGPEEPPLRQIQFSTPGGTQVVWVLTTDDVL